MADNTQQNANDNLRTIDKSGIKVGVSVLDIGGAGAELLLSLTNPLPTAFTSTADVLVKAGDAVNNALRVNVVAGAALPVTDNGGSLTVDGTLAATQSGAWTVTANAGAGPFPVSDNGGSLTVDGTVAATQSGTWSTRTQDGAGNALTSKVAGSERALSIAIVDGAGNQVTSFGGSGGTSATDDAAFTPASGSLTPVGGIVTSDSVDAGDVGAFAMLANRQQKVTLYDSAGVELAVGGGTQYTEDAAAAANPIGNALILVRNDARSGSLVTTDGDNIAARGTNSGELYVKHVDAIPVTDNAGSLTVDNAGTFVVQVSTALPAGTNNIGDVDVLTVPADPFGANADAASATGSISAKLRFIAATGIPITGTVAVAENGAALTALQLIDNIVQAEDGVHSSGHSGVMALGVRNDAGTALAADGDYIPLSIDSAGALRVTGGGGGTQYTEGDIDASLTGTVMLWEDTSDTVRAVSAAKPLPVQQAALTSGTDTVAIGGSALTSLQLIDNIVLLEDAAHVSADPGIQMLAVRRDTAAVGSGTDGDYSTLNVNASGRLYTSATIDAALPAGTNNIGDVDVLSLPALPAGTNNIGDVDVLSVVPGTGATALGKAIDSAAGATDTGVAVLAVRDDSLSALTPVEGDYVPLRVNSTGALHVTGGGGGTQFAVDAVAGASDVGTLALAVRDDATATLTPADGDYTQLRVNSRGELWVDLATRLAGPTLSGAGLDAVAAEGGAAHDAAVSGNPLLMGAYASSTAPTNVSANGDAVRLWADLAGRLQIGDGGGSLTVDNGGTFVVQVNAAIPAGTNNIGDVDVLTLPNVTLAAGTNTNEVVGDVAQDAAVAGNPVLIGARASTATPTAMSADGDAVYPWATREGALVVAGTIVDDAAFTVATSRIQPVGFLVDDASTDSADEGDAAIPRITPDRRVIVVPQGHSAGGLSTHRSIDLDEGTLEVVKASPGCVYGMWVTNTATATRWIKFYDATSGTAGTGTPKITIGIPGNTSDDISGSFGPGGLGVGFTTGICVGATTGVADADTGAPAANDVIVNIFFS